MNFRFVQTPNSCFSSGNNESAFDNNDAIANFTHDNTTDSIKFKAKIPGQKENDDTAYVQIIKPK